jgi:outer membrane receptor protein involved in Fe transport
MKPLLTLLSCLFISLTLSAQISLVQGKVLDENKTPLPFVNVSLVRLPDTNKSLSTVLTDSAGNYAIPIPEKGKYRLRYSAIGFVNYEGDTLDFSSDATEKKLTELILKKEIKELQNVDIVASRPTITQLPDRLVIGVQGTAMAAGNTAFGVLSKSPGVFVDPEGAIQLNGRGGVTVMIDGRLTFLSARDLRNLLESTPAENIKSIELITNPSAKYDAEGTSGIINIVFKKNVLQGINGNVFTTYSTNFKQHFYGAGATINYKSGRWNSFFITDFNRRGSGREATFTRIFRNNGRTTYFDQTAEANWTNIGPPSLRLGADYAFNSNHSLGFITTYNTNTADADFLTQTYIGPAPKTPAQFVDAKNYNSNTLKHFVTNLHYVGKLDTVGTTLSTDFDIARIRNKGEGNFFNTFTEISTGQITTDNLYTYTPNGFDVYSAKIDFAHPFNSKHKIETGGRVSRVVSDNDFRFYFNNNGKVLDPLRTNHFYYTENIYAGYINWIGTLTKKLSVQTGLRAEQTRSRGTSFTTGETTPRKYLDWFPSVFVQYKGSDNYNLTLNYSRRINRPNYGNLNPFRAYRDPYTWTVGNPYLRPQYTHSFQLSQTFKKLYIVQAFYQHTTDVMIELPMPDAVNAVTVYTTGNVDDSYSGGVLTIIPVKLARWWDTRNTGQLSYSRFTTIQNGEAIVNDQLFYYLQSGHTLQLPKNFRAEATFLYRGPAAAGLYHQEAMYRIDLAFSKSFAKKKFEVALNINDLTKGWRFLWAANFGGNVNEFDQYLRWRTVGVTLRYNFSKGLKAELKQRSGPEELNRL